MIQLTAVFVSFFHLSFLEVQNEVTTLFTDCVCLGKYIVEVC